MAFILRSSKYGYNFLGLAHRASLTYRRKKILLEYKKIFKFKDLLTRTAATASPNPIQTTPFSIEKNISHLHSNLKANMVDLHIVQATLKSIKEKHGELTPSQLLLLLKCCGTAAFRDSEENRIKMAKNIWQMAKELGTELDIAHYNTLISIFIENNYKFSPEEILSEIKLAGLEPNSVTYRRLLKAFCQQGDIQGAGKLLEKMKEKNYPINEYDFCSLIQGHCEAGDLDEAEKIFNVMKDRGIQPTIDPYVYLLCGYAKHGNIKKMEELLDELNNQNIRMTDIYLLNIVYTLIVNNRSDYVDTVLARVKKFNDYEKSLMKIVHRLFHRNKDEEALKLFEFLGKMGYLPEYIENHALGIAEHFVYNRSPAEVIEICKKIEGWTNMAFSHALKKAVLRMDLDFCSNLMQGLRKNKFPIRPHYFWPLIVRYSEQGNSGILSVLKVMKSLSVTPCFNTVMMFINEYYKFDGNWSIEIDNLKKQGVKECQASLIALYDALGKGNINDAEFIASSYGIFKPQKRLLDFLAKNFAKWCPYEEEKFVNILYCLAHDFSVYNASASQEGPETEEDKENELTGLNMFFDKAISALMSNCPGDVFLSVLQNASKKKLIISPQTASSILQNFNNSGVDVFLKEFVDSDEFELNEELFKKKSLNATIIPKSFDPSGLINLANQNDPRAEKLWEERGSEVSLEEHIAILAMFSRMKMYDKAFEVIDRLKDLQGTQDPLILKRFRVALHILRKSMNVEKMINAYKVAVDLGLIDEHHVIPVLRTILSCTDADKAVKEYFPFFEKIKTVGIFLEVMTHVIPTRNTEIIEKITEIFSRATNEHSALTALFTAYLANGCNSEARQLLENKSFIFQTNVFLYWFNSAFINSEKPFNEAVEIIRNLRPIDRTPVYASMLSKYKREKNHEKIKLLCLQCQEDSSTDPFFLEHLRQCLQIFEKGRGPSDSDILQKESSNMIPWNEDKEWKKFQGLLKANKCTDEMLEKLIAGKVPQSIARKVLPLLAAEGKSYELILIINRYRFGRFVPEIATAMLKKNKVREFLEFVTTLGSMKKYGGVYNCFASQEERILNLVKTNEEFFQKFAELSERCYEEGKYEALLVFFMKVCVLVPEKLKKAEELLNTDDSRIVSHFRNYSLSNMLLSSTEEVDFYENVLRNEKVKSVFAEALDHFYDRVINFHNEKGDLKTALSYLEEAKKDGVDEKLSKRLLTSLKKNVEDKGATFPYPYLLQEAA